MLSPSFMGGCSCLAERVGPAIRDIRLSQSSFVPRTKHRDRAGGNGSLFVFHNNFSSLIYDMFSVAPACSSKKIKERT